jgi:Right handed beta helix region
VAKLEYQASLKGAASNGSGVTGPRNRRHCARRTIRNQGRSSSMKRIVVVAISLSFALASGASAQVARVFLSGTGNDAGDCSNQATPCRSLQAAIDQSPVGGEVIVLTSGGFGTANITKSITINAPDGVLAFNARTVTVNIGASDKVTIRGVAMNGAVFGDAFGINFTGGGTLVVEHSAIRGFSSANIESTATGGKLIVRDTEIANSGSSGIVVVPAGAGATSVTVEDCRLVGNTQSGILIYDYVKAVVRNTLSTNNFEGFALLSYIVANTGTMLLDGCVASFNHTGVYSFANGGTGRIRVSNSTIFNNASGISSNALGGTSSIVSYGNNRVFGNSADETFSSTVAPQ